MQDANETGVHPSEKGKMILTRDEVRQVLRIKLGHNNFTIETFTVTDVDTFRFHSDNHSVVITAKVGQRTEEFSFFMKSVNTDCVIFKRYLGPAKLFEKEHRVLSDVIPDLQTAAPRKITCDCYLSEPFKCIVLENLTLLGFKPLGTFLDTEHARVAIQALANLHTASIVKEETNGVNLGEKFKDFIYESLIVAKDPPEESLVHSFDTILRQIGRQCLTHLSLETQKKLFNRLRQAVLDLSQPSTQFRNVVTQGDPWGGNLMFKYDENGKPIEALLVDFQAVRYTPPAQELMSFLHIAAPDSEFILKHSEELIEIYYSKLSQFLLEKGIDVARALPKNEFLDSCEVYKEFGIAARVFYALSIRLPSKYLSVLVDSPKMYCDFMVGGDFKISIQAYRNDSQYKKVIDQCIEAAVKFYKDLS